jgi:peptide/nickel transport system permease protein
MLKLIGYRLLSAIPLIVLISIAAFLLLHLMPGSPAAAILGPRATPEGIERLEERLGLDHPLPVQYASWLGNALHGDLGKSLASSVPVTTLISNRLVPSLSLVSASLVVALALGLSMGMVAALRRGSFVDRTIQITSAGGLAIPEFWLGIILLGIFAARLRIFPVVSWTPPGRDLSEWARGLVLPSLSLGIMLSATIMRQMRGAMLETLEAPFIQTLRAIGTPWPKVVFRYAVKNALVPVMTIVAFLTVLSIGTSFVIEKVYTIPGIGSLMLDSLSQKDIPVVQGVVLLISVAVVFIYMLMDIGLGLLNPRARPQ